MPAEGVNRSAPTLSLRLSLLFLCGGFVGGSAVLLSILIAQGGGPTWALWGYTAACWLYFLAGCVAWWRRPSNAMGPLIAWGGVAILLILVGSSTVALPASIGAVTATLTFAVIVHLLHAFPSGRLRSRASRITVLAGYIVCLPLQFPLYAFDSSLTGLPVYVADRPDLLTLGRHVQTAAGASVMLATIVILALRLRRAKAWQRKVLIPLFGYGMFAALFIPVSSSLLRSLGWTQVHIGMAQLIVVAGVPVAFALGVLRGGFARTHELEELAAWLSAPKETRVDLTSALAGVLGDPFLQLVFWVPERRTYVNSAGVWADLPDPGAARSSVRIELSGELIGAVIYDSELIADPELVRTAARLVALGVDRERLTAALRATEQSLRRSRERLVETADRERRRIAQDLHDGLQVKLVLLAVDAQQLANQLGAASPMRESATELRRRIDVAAAELRSLVHAVMPSSLVERGLGFAAEDLVDRLPVPAELHLGTIGTLPDSAASTAYFVVAEALTNVVKHAAATKVIVRIHESDGTLTIDVTDNGRGGASRDGGTGLRGLIDRVDVLGGSFTLFSPVGSGTTVSVRLPVWRDVERRTDETLRPATALDLRPTDSVSAVNDLVALDSVPGLMTRFSRHERKSSAS